MKVRTQNQTTVEPAARSRAQLIERKFKRRLLLGIGFLVCISGLAFGEGQEPRVHPSRVLAKPRPGVRTAGAELKAVHQGLGAKVRREHPEIGGLQVIDLPENVSLEQAVQHYQRSGLFEYVEPDYQVQISAMPNDPACVNGLLWGMQKINAPSAWDIRTSAEDVVVAVIDTGIRYTHEDLAANMWRNPGETGLDANGNDKATNGIDDDGDGYVDDVYGINAITGTGNPDDDFFHGTHCAGTIGGAGNNGVGVAGVAWRVKLMACKFLNNGGSGFISDAITCIDYARKKGARIMSNSWAGGGYSQALVDAIAAARSEGIIFVAAAGNSSGDNDINPTYPASYDLDNIVSVAATDDYDGLAYFSCFGQTSVDLGAPGVGIYSCLNSGDNAYGYESGTSMATPHVAGAFALLTAQFPTKSYAELIRRMFDTVDPISALSGQCVTGGRLNLSKALELSPPTGLTPGSPYPDGSVIVHSDPVTLSWKASDGADRYQVVVFYWDAAVGNWVYDTLVTTTESSFSYSPSVNKTHYAWTVQAGNSSRWSDWANWAFFYGDFPCTCALSPASAVLPAAGGTGSVGVHALSGCDWSAQAKAHWITITSTGIGNGNGNVTYSVAANLSKRIRNGTVTIGDQTFIVTQKGK